MDRNRDSMLRLPIYDELCQVDLSDYVITEAQSNLDEAMSGSCRRRDVALTIGGRSRTRGPGDSMLNLGRALPCHVAYSAEVSPFPHVG
jgi:hypothetical protein